MNYKALWHEDALRDLKNIGRKEAQEIIKKVKTYLLKEPLKLGKLLKGHLRGFYRYRIGKYRVIYLIKEKELLIVVLKVAKRDKIYKICL
ncbi:MAG: type II toxin-antitoxin system RelE/ParE family toxin [Armatimonadetes bacterium]|nr:type II toxin-antitoxin system RelE/ParE family toxin [Armatimonadota bacterium]